MDLNNKIQKVNPGMVDEQPAGALPWSVKLFYGVGDLGNAVINSAIQLFLMKFYTDAALILPALAGNALLLGKIWDAVNDPLFGWITDRTSSPFGKRRVFMIFGALPLGISIALLWLVPVGMSSLMTFIWITFSFILFDTMWTLTNVPFYSLTSELTENYDERSALTVIRNLMAVPAYLLGASITPIIVGAFAIQRSGFAAIGIAYGALATLALWVSAAGIRERKMTNRPVANHSNPVSSLIETFKNIPFMRLCVAYMVFSFSFGLVKTLMVYFLEYQLKMPGQSSLVLGLMLGSVVISLYIWKKVSDYWDKGPAYALGMGIGAIAVAATFLLPHDQVNSIYILAIAAGFGFTTQWVFPWAIVADVVDYDRLKTGVQRAGMYYGVWGLTMKISEALALVSTGWILTGFGYVANVEQTALARLGIRLFFGPVPAILILAALPLLIWFPLNRKRHAEIMAKLNTIQSKVADGLPIS